MLFFHQVVRRSWEVVLAYVCLQALEGWLDVLVDRTHSVLAFLAEICCINFRSESVWRSVQGCRDCLLANFLALDVI